MNIQYDKKMDSMYIPLGKGTYHHNNKINDSIVVDVSDEDKIIGIEILDASTTIDAFDPKRIEFVGK